MEWLLRTPVAQMLFPESLSLEECGELASTVDLALVASLKDVIVLVSRTIHGCTGHENDFGEAMARLVF
jgi:hypothetical protein